MGDQVSHPIWKAMTTYPLDCNLVWLPDSDLATTQTRGCVDWKTFNAQVNRANYASRLRPVLGECSRKIIRHWINLAVIARRSLVNVAAPDV